LAVELVRCILEFAATEDNQTSLALAHVSKAVQKWIYPIIYHTVVLTRTNQMQSFHRTLQATQTSVGARVRRLILNFQARYHIMIAETVYACTELEVLVTGADLRENTFVEMNSPSIPAPWHVILLPVSLARLLMLGHPLLRIITHITHLCLDLIDQDFLKAIQSFPLLTHLGVGYWGDV
jgi:hypothetical protein